MKTELERLIERAKREYQNWIIFENKNGFLFLIDADNSNSYMGTYEMKRICDSSEFKKVS